MTTVDATSAKRICPDASVPLIGGAPGFKRHIGTTPVCRAAAPCAPAPVVIATTLVIGAPRAPRHPAVAKRGQMIGGPGDSLTQETSAGTGVISEGIRRLRPVRP